MHIQRFFLTLYSGCIFVEQLAVSSDVGRGSGREVWWTGVLSSGVQGRDPVGVGGGARKPGFGAETTQVMFT